ncbi:uncharacterized protein [Engystomops pustulosus]|uniref:uncharacterized protein n=1 Tax=Engystomops pustulosus TaxID=76066 RepID=UPI003AFABDCD
MPVCTDHSRISDFLHRSLMMHKDKMEVTEKILNLTLEIIFLLTGEDLVLSKKQEEGSADGCQECLSEGPTMDQTAREDHPEPEEPKEEETPEPPETTHSAAQEVPVRCEDVAVFFSMEEWEYLEEHKEQYQDVVSQENNTSPAPPGGNISTNNPEICMSPLIPERGFLEESPTLTSEYQTDPVEVVPSPQCKEEDIPVEISTDVHLFMKTPEMRRSPVCFQEENEDNGVIPQEYPVTAGHNMEPDWCKKEPQPIEISADLPTSWKVQPDPHHMLIPHQHKNWLDPSHLESGVPNESPLKMPMAKPKTVVNAVTWRSSTDLPHVFWQKPQVAASSRNGIDPISQRRTHHETFHCASCQQSFMDRSALVLHEWTFHSHEAKMGESQTKHEAKEERPFSCMECGKLFKKKSSLVKHQRIHTGAFTCPDCGKCLSDKTGLTVHRRTHTGEKPYVCLECGRRFTDNSHLVRHKRSHTGEKPYSCIKCGKCFSDKSNLVKHERTHRADKSLSYRIVGNML